MSTLDLDDVANLTLSTAMKLQEPIIKVGGSINESRTYGALMNFTTPSVPGNLL